MENYFCPNCGADLEAQEGFVESVLEWECSYCGMELINPDTIEMPDNVWKTNEPENILKITYHFNGCTYSEKHVTNEPLSVSKYANILKQSEINARKECKKNKSISYRKLYIWFCLFIVLLIIIVFGYIRLTR